jgi:hypothetical protein
VPAHDFCNANGFHRSHAYTDELVVGRRDHTEERPAPRLPTPVTFPNLAILEDIRVTEWTEESKPDLFGLRLRWQYSPQGNQNGATQVLGHDMWDAINCTFTPACNLEEFFGIEQLAEFLPPKSWAHEEPDSDQRKEMCGPPQTSVPSANGIIPPRKLPNGRPWPARGDFWDRVAQLKYSNLNGFQGYARITKDGTHPPRLTHARPFYEHLDGMIQYWDTSKDEYIPPKAPTAEAAPPPSPSEITTEPRKRTKLSPEISTTTSCEVATLADTAATPTAAPPSSIRFTRRGRTYSPPRPTGTYRGWRIDSGRNMPNVTRDMLVKALLEIGVWPFGFHVDSGERAPPRLEIKTLRVGVPLTRRVWRPPTDRIEARSGVVYGPVLGMSCRPIVAFDEKALTGEVDLLRELGSLLTLAQERRRENRTEKRPGEGAWWSEKPRFAGMPYEVPGEYEFSSKTEEEEEEEEEEEPQPVASTERRMLGYTARREKEKQRKRDELPPDMTARQRAIHAYKKFLPERSSWEKKARYVPTGKEKGSEFDEVRNTNTNTPPPC